MNDPSDNIESRLSRLQLRSVSAGLEQRIGRELDEVPTGKSTCPCHPKFEFGASPRADRWLWSAITSGAIAACVIVAVWVVDAQSGALSAPLPLTRHVQPTTSSGPALASAAQSWGDELGPALYGSHP